MANSTRVLARGAAAMVLLLAVACGGSDADDPTTSTSTSRAAAGSTTPIVAELVGRWAHYDVVAYQDAVMKTLIVSYGFSDFEVRGDELWELDSFCFARQVSDQPIRTEISDTATQAIRPVPTPVEVTEADGVIRVKRPPTPTLVGIRLDDPANETLPTDPNDPRILDDDADGNPGITVKISGEAGPIGDLYLARREIFASDLTVDGPDLMTGTVTDTSEQLIIGATNPALNIATQWVQYPDLSRSPIILKRVDPDWNCERLKAESASIFPTDAAIDW